MTYAATSKIRNPYVTLYPFRWIRLATLLAALSFVVDLAADEYAAKRNLLVKEIEQDVEHTSLYLGRETLSPKVADVLREVPRHLFVPKNQRKYAYENRPLPIGFGQTISQPYIVAIMTDLLDVDADDRVFELGTGSGYQAAVLAPLVDRVYSVEIIEPLGERARKTLEQLGYTNVEVRVGDGYYGWKEAAPFDAIVVTAAGDHIPPPLVRQLKAGGRMIIPVGSGFFTQQLMLVTKLADGSIETREILPVRFVPLTGSH